MKTVTVQLQTLITNFFASQSDYILDCGEWIGGNEDDIEQLLKDLRNLLNPKRGLVPCTLRRLFSEGFTMMMLTSDQFQFLETAVDQGDEFAVVVKNGKETLCILCEKELVW